MQCLKPRRPPLSLHLAMAFLLLLVSPLLPSLQAASDTEALSIFRHGADAHGILASNWTTADACGGFWRGVVCSAGGRVTSLSLPSLDLRGPLDPLSHLSHLRLLDLHDNRINGTLLPFLFSLPNLSLLYLSRNSLSGGIPPSIGCLASLIRVDLSDNNLDGLIPCEALSSLTRLLTLRLQCNLLSGNLPDLAAALPALVQLNVSNNDLAGRAPDGILAKFGLDAVSGNAGLCGLTPPLPLCDSPPSSSSLQTEYQKRSLSTAAIISIVISSIALFAFFLSAYCFCAGRRRTGSDGKVDAEEQRSCGGGGDAGKQNQLVFLQGTARPFELDELLRASAEMLGRGSIGTVYKAVLEGGAAVAVKRLKDSNPCPRKDFNQYMNLIGRLSHPNILPLRAYCYAEQEKLLIYDYLPNGNLSSALRFSTGRAPLDWTTRVSLALGAARGLAQIHAECAGSKIPHGNIKSSNVLLDKNGAALVSDFGLALLLSPAQATAGHGGCAAPEQEDTRSLSQEADVYAFGIILLEILTGRPAHTGQGTSLPEWVKSAVAEDWTAEIFDAGLMRYKNAGDEMLAVLRLALACLARLPDDRPAMSEVVAMIQEIRVQDSPLADEDDEIDESRLASASPSLPTTD